MQPGMICWFYGLIAAIPDGWLLCDGSNDTPDLRNYFVFGAGGWLNPGSHAITFPHLHAFSSALHNHGRVPGPDMAIGIGTWITNSMVGVTGTTDPASNLPPYYALSYIMKDG